MNTTLRHSRQLLLVAGLCLTLGAGSALAGPPPGFTPGVEGQHGLRPAAWSGDGQILAATRWDRASLLLVPSEGDGPVELCSSERGAGFHPRWTSDGQLLLKEVVDLGDGGVQQRIVRIAPASGERSVLATGSRLGDPSVSAGGLAVWSRGSTVSVRQPAASGSPVSRRFALPGYSNLVVLDPAGERLAFSHPDGRLGVLRLSDGHVRYLTAPGAYAHPAWSAGGKWLLIRAPGDRFLVLDPASGALQAEVEGTSPAWLGAADAVIFERVVTERFRVLSADLYLLEVDSGAITQLTTTPRHERYPVPSPDGERVAFTDTVSGDLLVAPTSQLGVAGAAAVLISAEQAPWTPPPPTPSPDRAVVAVPYMHQLWDTPDSFDGGWSCGPTSCVQTVQKYEMLPDHDITCSWPTPHTSHWGWYIPNEYSFNGYTYDIIGLAKGNAWVPGAHGFICRDLGAAYWAYMVDFCNQHGLTSWQAGTSFSTLTGEVDAGYPMIASTSVLGNGHIIVLRGYEADHSIVVNDPYGNANGSWGEYDGEGAVYDWPGYNNGHLEISLSQLFGAQGPLPDPDPEWAADWVDEDYPAEITAGESAEVWLEYRNSGTAGWDSAATRLGTTVPRDRSSAFYDSATWLDPSRPTAVDAATPSGEYGRFSFTLRAPEVAAETSYTECWGLVHEAQQPVIWFGPPDDEVCFQIVVRPPGDPGDPPDAGAGAAPPAATGGIPGGGDSGCSCRTAGRRSELPLALLWLVLGALAVRASSRRKSPCQARYPR